MCDVKRWFELRALARRLKAGPDVARFERLNDEVSDGGIARLANSYVSECRHR